MLFIFCCIQAYAKTPIPEALLNAKTALVRNVDAQEKDFDKFCEALKKWGRFELVQDRKSADILITLSAGFGIQNIERPVRVETHSSSSIDRLQSLQVQIYSIRITNARDDASLYSDKTPENPKSLVSNLKRKMKKD